MHGVFVVMDGLDIMLVIVMVIKLVVELMVHRVVLSLMVLGSIDWVVENNFATVRNIISVSKCAMDGVLVVRNWFDVMLVIVVVVKLVVSLMVDDVVLILMGVGRVVMI